MHLAGPLSNICLMKFETPFYQGPSITLLSQCVGVFFLQTQQMLLGLGVVFPKIYTDLKEKESMTKQKAWLNKVSQVSLRDAT